MINGYKSLFWLSVEIDNIKLLSSTKNYILYYIWMSCKKKRLKMLILRDICVKSDKIFSISIMLTTRVRYSSIHFKIVLTFIYVTTVKWLKYNNETLINHQSISIVSLWHSSSTEVLESMRQSYNRSILTITCKIGYIFVHCKHHIQYLVAENTLWIMSYHIKFGNNPSR